MANSKFFLGDFNIKSLKLGNSDVKVCLGDTLLYPLSKSIEDAVVSCAVATYNGSNQTAQSITVTLSGVTLVENTDYTVTQNTGGTNAGTYPVVVTGMGNYEGTASGTFTIVKANSSLSFAVTSLTVGKGETKTNAVTVNAGDGTVMYSSNNTTAVTVDNSGVVTGIGIGNATITANISSTNNYNSASTSYTASCAIAIIAKFNVTSTSSPTRIASATTNFSSIEIDGVMQPSVTTGYTFSTTGEHTIKYYLVGTNINNSAFDGCSGLTSIDIPSGVTSIGNSAFNMCTGLASINIPNGVTSIGTNAFNGCSSLTSIVIPDSVTSIRDFVFSGCISLSSCTIGSGVTSIGIQAFRYCSGLTSIDIPNSVTSIDNNSFMYCSNLASCTIGSGVTSIGNGAFQQCSGLTNIDIPSGVTSIGQQAFYLCSGLTSITVNATTPPTLSNYNAFSNTNNCPIYVPCESVDTYKAASGWSTYASRVQEIAGSCPPMVTAKFNVTDTTNPTRIASGTSSFTKIEIDDVEQQSVTTGYTFSTTGEHTVKYYLNSTSIDNGAFNSCSGITSCTINSGVTSIGSAAFFNCSGLTSIDMPNSVTSIGSAAFNGCSSLSSIDISDNVTSIGSHAFYNCTSLTNIDIPDSVTSIDNYTFAYCSGLTTCTIGSGVTSIGNYTFAYCSGLTSIVIPDGVTSIGGNTFNGCSGLTSCTIGSGVTSIYDYAFYNCGSLTSIDIPDSVTSIGSYAFNSCSGLTSCTISSGLTRIENSVFGYCKRLKSIVIPNSVTTINSYAFQGCTSLSSCTIGSGVAAIGSYAFASCIFTSIEIPSGVTSIGSYAFYSCSDLTSITVEATTPPTLGSGAFDNTNNCPIYVPCDSVDTYEAASGWSTYASRINSPCNGHTYVDLGLPSGTKWATMNVGASSEADYGNYYQYGKGAAQYAATSGDSKYSGTEDPLDSSVDTAAQVWGGSWHMPTRAQMQELTANTTYEWTTINGVNGGKFTATNGNYVFFPAAGSWYNGSQYSVGNGGYYWGSSPDGSNYAYRLGFDASSKGVSNNSDRKLGYSVRPVIG